MVQEDQFLTALLEEGRQVIREKFGEDLHPGAVIHPGGGVQGDVGLAAPGRQVDDLAGGVLETDVATLRRRNPEVASRPKPPP